jgi:hypothetical protein
VHGRSRRDPYLFVCSGGCFPRSVELAFRQSADGAAVAVVDRWAARCRIEAAVPPAVLAELCGEIAARSEPLAPGPPPVASPGVVPPLVSGPPPWVEAWIPDGSGVVERRVAYGEDTVAWTLAWVERIARLPGARRQSLESKPPPASWLGRASKRLWEASLPWLVFYAFILLIALGYWLVR